jgi:hypothetical protein
MRTFACFGAAALAIAVVIGLLPVQTALPQEDEPAPPNAVVAEPSRRGRSVDFDRMVFGDARPQTVMAAHDRLREILARKVAALDRIHGLSESQKEKLKLAGRGDIKRLEDRLASQRQNFLAPPRVVRGNQVIQFRDPETSALRALMKSGPFGDDSLFVKAQKTILTSEQLKKSDQRRQLAARSTKTITIDNAATLEPISRVLKDVCQMKWRREDNEVGLLEFDEAARICSGDDFRTLRTFGVGHKVMSFDFSRNREVVAIAENSTKAFVINLLTAKETAVETGNPQPGVAFSPDGKMLATGGYGTKAALWSVESGRQIGTFNTGGVAGGLTPIFSPDGAVLAVGNRNSTTCLFDVATGRVLRELPRRMTQELKFDPAGKRLATAYVDGNLGVWNVESGELLQLVKARAEELYSVDWSPNGQIIASSGRDASVTLWNAGNLAVINEIECPEWVICVRLNPQGTRLLFAGGSRMPGGERYVQIMGVP